MQSHSSAISDNDFTQGQKPVATPPRKPRPKEFWEAEPEDAELQGWKDDPNDPTGPQIVSIANPTNPAPKATPPKPFENKFGVNVGCVASPVEGNGSLGSSKKSSMISKKL